MSRATIAAIVVEMADGRLAVLLEMEPDPGFGPLIIDSISEACELASSDTMPKRGSATTSGSWLSYMTARSPS